MTKRSDDLDFVNRRLLELAAKMKLKKAKPSSTMPPLARQSRVKKQDEWSYAMASVERNVPQPKPQPPKPPPQHVRNKVTKRARKASKAGKPTLDDLAGMQNARTVGLALRQDWHDFRHGKISWQDVASGFYLSGPPGTGKTMFGSTLAEACGVTFIATSFGKWQSAEGGHLGSCMQAMTQDFEEAKEKRPCILFIDELDSLPSRGRSNNDSYYGALVNHMLKLLDGLNEMENVVVIGACNQPEKLDPALVRSGRLGEAIEVMLPSLDELPDIISFHLRDHELIYADLSEIALMCHGMSGADVQKMVQDARRIARQKNQIFSTSHFFDVLRQNFAPLKSATRERVAIHEAGHALVALHLETIEKPSATVLQRGSRQGFVDPTQLERGATRDTIERHLAVLLAGRVAEELFVGNVSADAGGPETSDLAQATILALKSVTNLGLSDCGLTPWIDSDGRTTLSHYSSDIQEEVKAMLAAATARARSLLSDHKLHHHAIATVLMDKHAINYDTILAVRPRLLDLLH